MFSKIAIASDHAGVLLKSQVIRYLNEKGIETIDLGPNTDKESVDYPDYAEKVASKVAKGETQVGIAICGTGIGMSIAANKHPKIRAVCPWDTHTAEMTRKHNNANILCLGARTLSAQEAINILETWLSTSFMQDRHSKRIEKISAFESK